MTNAKSFLTADSNHIVKGGVQLGQPVTGNLQVRDVEGLKNGNISVLGAPKGGEFKILSITTLEDGITTNVEWEYTPTDPNFSGWANTLLKIVDDEGNSSSQFVQVKVEKALDHVDANSDSAAVRAGSNVNIDVLGNDVYSTAGTVNKGEGLTITAINGQAIEVGGSVKVDKGTVTLLQDGTLNFKADVGYVATDASFNYTVTSPNGVSDVAAVGIAIAAYNPPAYATAGDTGKGTIGSVITGDLDVADYNGISNPNFQFFNQNGSGNFTIDAETGKWSYTSTNAGSEVIHIKVTDDLKAVSTVGITIETLPLDLGTAGIIG